MELPITENTENEMIGSDEREGNIYVKVFV